MTNIQTTLKNVQAGDPFARIESGTILEVYDAGVPLTEEHFKLLYPTQAFQRTAFQQRMGILAHADGRYTAVSGRVLDSMATSGDYSARSRADLFDFPFTDAEVEEVTATELINLVGASSGPSCVIFRKKPKMLANKQDQWDEFATMPYEERRDIFMGEIRVLFGQKPTHETTALANAKQGKSYGDQLTDTTRQEAGYTYMVDYNKPFGGGGNLVQVGMDRLLAYVDTSAQKVYITKTASGKVTKATQKRILDKLRQGIAALSA